MDAVVLSLLAGLFFGGVTVATRLGFRAVPDPVLGGLSFALVALPLEIVAALAAGVRPADFAFSETWPYVVIGLFVPGMSQILYVYAIRDAGASRCGIVMGTFPLLSAILALAFLGEPFRVTLVIGTVLIVAAGLALAYEPERPQAFRAIGIVFALGCAVMLAARDNVVRALVGDHELPPLGRAVALIFGCCVFVAGYLAMTRGRSGFANLPRALVVFAPAGACMCLVYATLLTALDRGKVTIVAPLNGTNALWTVVLAAVFLRQTEAIGWRLVLAAVLTVAGGGLVAAFR